MKANVQDNVSLYKTSNIRGKQYLELKLSLLTPKTYPNLMSIDQFLCDFIVQANTQTNGQT